MAFSGLRKNLDEWRIGGLGRREDSRRLARDPLRQRVFEGARCYATPRGSACFRLDAHMRRLYDSAKIYRMTPVLAQDALTDAVLETIRANEYKACYIRPIVYRGYEELGVNPFPCPVDTAILTWEWGAYLGDDAVKRGADVRVSSWSRAALNTVPDAGEELGELRQLTADQDGSDRRRLQRGIALDTQGNLSEGSGQNLFLVRDGVLYTPSTAAAILPGITRDTVITLARDLGFTGARGHAAARDALHRGRGVLRRHRRPRSRRSARSTRSRSAPASARSPSAAPRLLRRHQRRCARPPQLADVRLSGRAARAGSTTGRRRRARAESLRGVWLATAQCTSTTC
jgi:branched-chain amino acid aminotransferase group I